MEFEVWTKGLATLAVDCLVVGVLEETELGAEARAVAAGASTRVSQASTAVSSAASSATGR